VGSVRFIAEVLFSINRRREKMKRLVMFGILVSLVFVPSIYAQQKYSLGVGNVALKVDYFRFTDSNLGDLDLQNGVYLGIEGYVNAFLPNLYFGIETGWAGTSGDFKYREFKADLSTTYVPIEFNIKYAFDLSPGFIFDLGAGLSANYFNLEADVRGWSTSSDDWLFGGQFFADVDYKFADGWFVGANIKYQVTQDIHLNGIDTDTSASNFRVGGQVGFQF
jgi:hypothetical protein